MPIQTIPFAEAQLALLQSFAECSPLPAVKALHLPPPEAAGTKDGEFCAIELTDGSLGLSYVMLDDTLAALRNAPDSQGLVGQDPLAVARWFAGHTGVRRTLGFAAINALSRCLFDRTGFAPDLQTDSIGMLDPNAGDHVGMIGFFPPLVDQIATCGARLTIVELNPDLVGDHPGYRVTLDAGELAACNKVLSTSTVLLNDTLDRMLAACSGAAHFAMVGPGAGCLPDPLFARGVTLLGGAWITEPEAFVDALQGGRRWGAHARKFAIRRDAYPGAAALLARLQR